MYQFKSRVRFSEVDSQLNMTLPSIINYFQDCSTFHSDSIGQGIEVMMAQGYAWILSSWQIIINRYPRFGEEITISTWAHGWKAFFGYRNFKMEDTNGNVLAYSNTNWIYMNIKTGRPERIPKEISDLYASEPAIPMQEASRKIAPVTEGISLAPIHVHKYDIDSNNHVNNERYVPMAMECLPDGFTIRQLRVEYRNSAVYGDTIYPLYHQEGDTLKVSLNDANGKPYAIVEFQS